MFAFDLHVHTTAGSADASLRVQRLGEVARAAGLTGVLVTEHLRQWTPYEVAAAREEQGIIVIPAREWSTPLGHILALGVSNQSPELRDPARLRAAADAEGGFLIAAHPFRHFFDAPRQGQHPSSLRTTDPAEAARLPLFSFVDAIEAINGNCTARENAFAEAVAAELDLPTTAGSDAHYEADLGRCSTLLPAPVLTIPELIDALRSRAHSLSGFDSSA